MPYKREFDLNTEKMQPFQVTEYKGLALTNP